MKPKPTPEIENRLAEFRRKRGIPAVSLARSAGVSRQTIYAIESGTYIPNTAVALQLARALEASVEEVFSLADSLTEAQPRREEALSLPGCELPQADQPVQLCRVDKRLMAIAPSPAPWYLPASDGVATGRSGKDGKTTVEILHPEHEFGNRLLMAGCDPAVSVLARHVQSAGIELVLVHRNSSQALQLLKQGMVHIAGTHLKDEGSGESNLPEIRRQFPKGGIAVISFSVWEEGIVTARGNPKKIQGIADLARPDISLINREKGSGSRNLLDTHLKGLGISGQRVRGYEQIAFGHLPAAWQVRCGAADCCVATRAAAKIYGLSFIPLVSGRYDLAIRKRHLNLPSVQTLLDALNRSSFRRDLESFGGYDARTAGQRML
jgi:molybdate-binding protein/DNA-binding XRE family transcriptional regulator